MNSPQTTQDRGTFTRGKRRGLSKAPGGSDLAGAHPSPDSQQQRSRGVSCWPQPPPRRRRALRPTIRAQAPSGAKDGLGLRGAGRTES